ncbi:Alginate export [Nitrosomonas sp. Nm33]|nr:Alginate export [Nitrosomonas sp. Nm33]
MAASQAQGLPLVQPEKAVAPEIRSFAGNHLHAMTGDVDLPLSKNAQSIATQKSMPTPHAPPPFKSLRYDEDYRYLHEPQRQSDFWDSIKYIPIKDRENWFLSIGGEMRQRYEFYHNPNFGAGPSDSRGNNDYLLQRYFLHADLHLGQHLRFFGQFMSSLEDGRIGGPRPEVDRNVFDVHQGFMDLVILFKDMMPLTLRLGRQEFEYGSGRLISVREVPNTRRSFDAARLLFRVNKWAIDGFWGKPVRNRFSVFDDDPDPNKSLWGVYAVRSHSFLPDGHADLYYLGFENKQGVFAQGTAHEVRHTLGTRLWGQPLPWEYNVELIWQFGRFGAGNIEAWAVATNLHYNLSNLPLRPRLGLTVDITSGDRNPASANLQTYNPLFPTGAYFNLADLLGPSNFIHVHPSVDIYFARVC